MSLSDISTTISLDLYDHDLTPSKIKAIALDSKTRYVNAQLTKGGQQYDIGQSTAVTLTIIRPDKTGVQVTGATYSYLVYIDGTETTMYGARAELTQTALAVSGTLQAQFMFTSGEQILRSEIFTINNGVALDSTVSEWAGEYQGYNLDELVQNVNESSAKVDAMEQDVSELKSGFNKLEADLDGVSEALVTKKKYTLTAPESMTVPSDVSEQSVYFDLAGSTSTDKIVTNKTAVGLAPWTPPKSNVYSFNVAKGSFVDISGQNIYVLIHLTLITATKLSITGGASVYNVSGSSVDGNVMTETGWYYIKAASGKGFSTGWLTTDSLTIDSIVTIDEGEITERYPEVAWSIATVIGNYPASKYGTLAAGETYSPQIADGAITVKHGDITSTYTGRTATVTIYPNDVITSTVGTATFSIVIGINLVRSVNNITPDANGNVDIGQIDSDGVPQIALMLCKNKNLVYKGEVTDSEIEGLTPSINDAYLYRTTKVHGLYKDPVCDGDILYWDGSDWCTMRLSPSTFDLYENDRHYDVVIVGGGAGGIGAAYALKDSGYSVCLIERLDCLGGTHVNAGVIEMLSSPAPDFLKAIIKDMDASGFIKTSNVKSYGSASESTFDKQWRGGYITPSDGRGTTYDINPWAMSKRYYDDLVNSGVDVLLGCDFVSVTSDGGAVENITVTNRHSGVTEKIWGFYFIDASSFASLCIYGKSQGTGYYTGTDSRARFNESAISDDYVADVTKVNTAEADYMFETVSGESFDAPLCKNTDAFKARQGLWGIPNRLGKNIKILSTDGSDRCGRYIFNPTLGKDYEYAVDQSKNRTKDHFRKYFGETSENRYIKPMPLIAMRETNRVACDYMLVQDDITTLATSSNYVEKRYIALASWGFDLHNKTGVNTDDLPTSARLCGLPYESIIPSAYKNVLVASKCFGASHIAASYFRLTKSCMSIGWAAGNAVKLAIGGGYIDDLRNVDIDDLQTAIGIGDMLTDIETYFTLT